MIDIPTLEAMLAAGASAEVIVAAVKSALLKVEERAAKSRERMRAVRERSRTTENVRAHPPSPSNGFPNNPSLTTPTPPSSLRSESIKSDWPKDFREQFWNAYPRKVGKKAAFRKLELVRRTGEIAFEGLLAAVGRIEASDPKFIPHPTTWLNEGRYLDGATGPPVEQSEADLKAEYARAREARNGNGHAGKLFQGSGSFHFGAVGEEQKKPAGGH